MIKNLLLFIFFVSTLSSFSQQQQITEASLLKDFKQINYWALNHTPLSDLINPYDSITKANKTFLSHLLQYTSQNTSSITASFDSLQNEGLSIATSPDNLFRIYSWNSRTGGTMHIFYSIFQYKNNGKVYSLKPPYVGEEGDAGSFYSAVYSVTGNNKTYYLGISNAILSAKDSYQSVKAFTIEKNKLNDTVRIIKTKTGIRNELGFEFDFFSVADHTERPVKLIFYDDKNKALKIPVVTEAGKVTNKFITYCFTGKHFEKSPIK